MEDLPFSEEKWRRCKMAEGIRGEVGRSDLEEREGREETGNTAFRMLLLLCSSVSILIALFRCISLAFLTVT